MIQEFLKGILTKRILARLATGKVVDWLFCVVGIYLAYMLTLDLNILTKNTEELAKEIKTLNGQMVTVVQAVADQKVKLERHESTLEKHSRALDDLNKSTPRGDNGLHKGRDGSSERGS